MLTVGVTYHYSCRTHQQREAGQVEALTDGVVLSLFCHLATDGQPIGSTAVRIAADWSLQITYSYHPTCKHLRS